MLSKQDLKFDKPPNLGEGTYKYEWIITYVAILNKLLIDLELECMCKKMIATENLVFQCMAHPGKNGFECCPVDYCIYNLEMFQTLLTNPSFYPNRSDIKGKGPLAFPQMFKRIHRMIAHIYHTTKTFLINMRKNIISMKDFFCFVKSIIKLTKRIFILSKNLLK
jgi:hypothetical protein